MVSSAKPKVVPPKVVKAKTKTTKKNSFPFVFLERADIPASKAPILLIIPIIPPRINTKIIISTVSKTPVMGALIVSKNP